MSIKQRLFGDPSVLELAADMLRFFRQADDPEAFRQALAEGEFERAFAMVDKPEDELLEEASKLRESSLKVAERHPGAIEKSHEELLGIEDE